MVPIIDGETVLDLMFVADPVKDMVEGVFVAGLIGELDAVIGPHAVDGVRHGSDHLASLRVQFDESELAGPVDCHEEA